MRPTGGAPPSRSPPPEASMPLVKIFPFPRPVPSSLSLPDALLSLPARHAPVPFLERPCRPLLAPLSDPGLCSKAKLDACFCGMESRLPAPIRFPGERHGEQPVWSLPFEGSDMAGMSATVLRTRSGRKVLALWPVLPSGCRYPRCIAAWYNGNSSSLHCSGAKFKSLWVQISAIDLFQGRNMQMLFPGRWLIYCDAWGCDNCCPSSAIEIEVHCSGLLQCLGLCGLRFQPQVYFKEEICRCSSQICVTPCGWRTEDKKHYTAPKQGDQNKAHNFQVN